MREYRTTEKKRASSRKYYDANKEKCKAAVAKCHAAKADEYRSRRNTPEFIQRRAIYFKKWYAVNRERIQIKRSTTEFMAHERERIRRKREGKNADAEKAQIQ